MSDCVYVIMVNFKSALDVIESVTALLDSDYKNFKIVVVDNDSNDDSLDVLKDWLTHSFNDKWIYEAYRHLDEESDERIRRIFSSGIKLYLIGSDYNGGFSFGNNIALRNIPDKSFIWLLNPDSVVERQSLKYLVERASNEPGRVIVGAVLKSYEDRNKIICYGGCRINYVKGTVTPVVARKEIDYIHGGALFGKYSVFKEVGLLPEQYFLYWEETDWCIRAKRIGYRFVIEDRAIVYDKVGGSIGRGYLAEYYYTLNALRVITKYKGVLFMVPILTTNVIRMVYRIAAFKLDRAKAILSASLNFLLKNY